MEALGIEARPSCMLSMHSTTELYPKLNAEFQRIARRDKKAFLSYQCKEIEQNNRMGKIRDFFRKIRDTKGKFHAKMFIIKNLTEAEEV